MEDTGVRHAPTRRPPQYPAGRRKPRGQRPVARTLHERLKTAAHQLRQEGHTASADAVEAVLVPGAWTMLREGESAFTTNLPLTMNERLRDSLKRAADRQLKNLSAVVAEGFRKVMDGSWTPPEPVRAQRGSVDHSKRVVLNVTIDDALRGEFREGLPVLQDELRYKRKLTEGGIAIAYMCHVLGVVDERTQTTDPT